jgi:two-component system, chemotaxis family, sensor kinase CheA
MSGPLETREFLAGYLAEVGEHLAAARKNLLAVEDSAKRGALAPRAVRELFRALHTVKGLSAMVGVEPVVDLAHELETVLRAADRAGGRVPDTAIDLLAQGLREIQGRVDRLSRDEPVPAAPPRLLEALAALDQPGVATPRAHLSLDPVLLAKLAPADVEELRAGIAGGRRALRVDVFPSPERAARGLTITAVRERLAALGDLVKVLPRSAAPGESSAAGLAFVLLLLTAADDAAVATAAEVDPGAILAVTIEGGADGGVPEEERVDEPSEAMQAFVRVDVARLDDALEHLSGLVVTRSRVLRAAQALAAAGADVRDLSQAIADQSRHLRLLRSAVMRARLVRVADVLERAPLLVRGLARATGKKVRLVVEAGDAEVDKAVGERLFPAIVHLLRNAVDHAIEPAPERVRAGKPEEALLRIGCRPASEGHLELFVQDDGRGIDAEAVARKAGVATPATAAELLDLIARPGLSTLDRPTRTSGRGVGMDVVRRTAVSELGGSLELETTPGAGSTFRLRVPLSLTIVDALTFECAGETYAVPASAVEDLVEVGATAGVAGPRPGGRGPLVALIERRGARVPFVRLDEALGGARAATARAKAIVVRRDSGLVAFGVDRMIGRTEVVVRPLSDPLVRVRGVAGATDLGDGRPTLVLDLVAIAQGLGAHAAEEHA